MKNNGLAREPMVAMYTPYPQRPWPAMQFAVRSAGGDPLALVNAVRAAVLEVDRDLPITRVETMDAALVGFDRDRAADDAAAASAFAAVALVMAAAGLYGVIAYTVDAAHAGDRRSRGARRRPAARWCGWSPPKACG